MANVLTGLGLSLILWGLYVLVTGDFVATLDIAAGLVSAGSVVIALSVIARGLERIAERMNARPSTMPVEQRSPVVESRQAPHANISAEPQDEDFEPLPEPRSLPSGISVPPPRRTAPPPIAPLPPAPAPTPQAPSLKQNEPTNDGPELVREGVIDGRVFRFYADGSIEAEGSNGIRRYASMDEAREQILRERAAEQAEKSEPVAAPAAAPKSPVRPSAPPRMPLPPLPVRQPPAPRQPQTSGPSAPPNAPRAELPKVPLSRPPLRPNVPPQSAATPSSSTASVTPAVRPSVTWDSYLSSGLAAPKPETKPAPAPTPAPAPSRAPEPKPAAGEPGDDDEWAEPFRMLLKGENFPSQSDSTKSKND